MSSRCSRARPRWRPRSCKSTASQSLEPGVAGEAQRISRDYDVLRKQYDKLLQDREELRLRGQVETERNAVKFEVIDPPTTPRAPAAPEPPAAAVRRAGARPRRRCRRGLRHEHAALVLLDRKQARNARSNCR